jgi:hypothetical protein
MTIFELSDSRKNMIARINAGDFANEAEAESLMSQINEVENKIIAWPVGDFSEMAEKLEVAAYDYQDNPESSHIRAATAAMADARRLAGAASN